MVAVYMLGTVILLVKGWRNMGHHKLITLTTCIAAANVVTIYQMIYPESPHILSGADICHYRFLSEC